MRYDPEHRTLTFASDEEVDHFHLQLTDMVRMAMRDAGEGTEGAEAVERSKAVFKQRNVILRALNELRSHLTRTPG